MQIRIMVVDDEPIAARSTSKLVKKCGAELEVVSVCHSGREAISQALLLHPDIIIMDIQMPGINGIEAMGAIRERDSAVRFIVLSAYSEFSYALQALNLGASDYLLKPVKLDHFSATLNRVVADVLARSVEMDAELQLRERVQLVEPMIKKDFIRALLPGAGADERLVTCANFLGIWEAVALVAVFAYRGGRGEELVQGVLEHAATLPGLFWDVPAPGRTVAYIPVHREGDVPSGIDEVRRLLAGGLDGNGMNIRCGIGDTAAGAINLKRSAVQALSALEYTSSRDRCVVFNGDTMNIKSEYVDAPDPDPPGLTSTNQIIDRARAFIQANYANDLTLDDAASAANLSPYYFSRLFKEVTGQRFSDYLLDVRIESAKALLSNTDLNIKDVSTRVGFNDPSYFSKVFHRATGYKASDYRAGNNPE